MFWEYATQAFVDNFLFNWELLSKHKSILENNHTDFVIILRIFICTCKTTFHDIQ